MPSNSELESARRCFANQPGESLRLLGDFLQREPHHAGAHNLLGVVLAQVGRQEEAAAEFSRALDLDSACKEEYLANRADAFFKLHRFDLAATDYETLIRLAPARSTYVYQRGLCRFNLGDDQGAADDYCAAIRCFATEQGQDLSGEDLLTYLYSMTLNSVEFLPQIWTTAAQIAEVYLPDSFFCPLAKGIVADHEENSEEAFKQLRAALQRDPKNRAGP